MYNWTFCSQSFLWCWLLLHIYIGRNQSSRPGRPWQSPQGWKFGVKRFQYKTCLNFVMLYLCLCLCLSPSLSLSLSLYIYITILCSWAGSLCSYVILREFFIAHFWISTEVGCVLTALTLMWYFGTLWWNGLTCKCALLSSMAEDYRGGFKSWRRLTVTHLLICYTFF